MESLEGQKGSKLDTIFYAFEYVCEFLWWQ